MLTIADYERLPMDLVRHQELVGGHLVDTADRTLLHNYTRDTVLFHLLHWAGRRRNGTVIGGQCFDFQGDILGPDVSFSVLEKESLWELDKRVQPFIPDLAIEVASSSDLYRDLLRKKDRYRRAGTSEVWLIFPESHEINIYSVSGNRILQSGDTLTSTLLPGFSVTLDDLFRGL